MASRSLSPGWRVRSLHTSAQDYDPRRLGLRSAGGMVVRCGSDGAPEILIVHRAKSDDWGLPKGRLESGESVGAAAIREVLEETGYYCEIADRLACTVYTDREGPSGICYFPMQVAVKVSPITPGEVDEARWVSIKTALRTVTFERERLAIERMAPALRRCLSDLSREPLEARVRS